MKNKSFKIIYDNGIIQYKNLVPIEEHNALEDLQTALSTIHENNKEALKQMKFKISTQKKKMGEYFLIGSPLYEAIKTGELCLPIIQGGCKPCTVIELL